MVSSEGTPYSLVLVDEERLVLGTEVNQVYGYLLHGVCK